jgi:hypothetical protein
MFNFADSLKIGQDGEAHISYALSRLGYKLIDVRNDASYQDIDIDLIGRKDDVETTFEIKTDTYTAKTGNIYYETVSNVEANVPGWTSKTKAQTLLYFPEGADYMYWIDMPKYREFVLSTASNYRKHSVENRRKSGRGFSTSEGLIVPVAVIEQFEWCQKVDMFKPEPE